METPKLIDNNQLKNILGSAKAIMEKVESGDYKSGNIDPRAITEETVSELISERHITKPIANDPTQFYKNLENSKLPSAIKESMIKNPIHAGDFPSYAFSLEDVMDFEKDEKKVPLPKSQVKKNTLTESRQQEKIIGLTESQVREIVNDEMIKFLSKFFIKTLAEDTKKKVIETLIKEGRLKKSK